MTYYHLPTDTERQPRRSGERKTSDGFLLTPPEGGWTEELAALCGFVPVVDTPRPDDTATTTHDRSVELVNGTPTVLWTQRAKTADELAAVQQEQHRSTLDQAIADAITDLLALAEYPAIPVVPAGTHTTANLSNYLRALRDEAQATRAGAQRVAETLANKIRLDRGDFAHLDD